MPYFSTNNRSDLRNSVKIDLTDSFLQVYDTTTNYCSFDINFIIGCSVLISKTETPNLIVNISYFNKNKKLSYLGLHVLNSELDKNEHGGIILPDWTKECLKHNKSETEFMVIDNKQIKKRDIEILRKTFKFEKIVYTNTYCLKDMIKSDTIQQSKFPNKIIIIGELEDYNKAVNLLGVKDRLYGFTNLDRCDETLFSMFFGKPYEKAYIKAHNEVTDFIVLEKIDYGLFAEKSRLGSLAEDLFYPNKLSYYVSGLCNDKPVTERLIDSKGLKIEIKDRNLLISLPKSDSGRLGLIFPSFNNYNSFKQFILSSVSVVCDNNGCFSADDVYNVSNVTRFKIADDTLHLF